MRRALTTRQPWASLIMAGVKDVENRSWPVPSTLPQWWQCPSQEDRLQPDDSCDECVPDGPFPFRLWIHAGKAYDEAAHRLAFDLDYIALPTLRQRDDLPRGVLLGSVRVTGCHWSDDCWRWDPVAPDAGKNGKPVAKAGERPGWCSVWAEPDAYHWTLADPQPLPEPIPMKGRQGLWALPDDVAVPA